MMCLLYFLTFEVNFRNTLLKIKQELTVYYSLNAQKYSAECSKPSLN